MADCGCAYLMSGEREEAAFVSDKSSGKERGSNTRLNNVVLGHTGHIGTRILRFELMQEQGISFQGPAHAIELLNIGPD